MITQDRNTDIVRVELTWDELTTVQNAIVRARKDALDKATRLKASPSFRSMWMNEVDHFDAVEGVIAQFVDAKKAAQSLTQVKPSPPATDSEGANLDPAACDCGKGAYCPLWTPEWKAFYNAFTVAEADRVTGRRA